MNTEQSLERSSADCDQSVFQADPNQPLSEAVVFAIATAAELEDPIDVASEFGPLYDAIDPSALDALFESTASTDRSAGSVSFAYADWTVTVDTTGRVELVPLES